MAALWMIAAAWGLTFVAVLAALTESVLAENEDDWSMGTLVWRLFVLGVLTLGLLLALPAAVT